jgi:hypothetical protein
MRTALSTCQVGDLTITAVPGSRHYEGQTPGRVDSVGRAAVYEVTGPQDTHLTLLDVHWDNGERDVRAVDRHSSAQRFDRLVHGLRLTVASTDTGLARADLRQARMVDDLWAKPRQASLAELSQPIGGPVDELLREHGALDIGPRSTLLADRSSHRNGLCVLFPTDAELVPPVAYAATRIAPVLRRVAA